MVDLDGVLQVNKLNTMKQQEFTIYGMTCMMCQSKVEKTLYAMEGVDQVILDLPSGFTQIEGRTLPSQEEISLALAGVGNYTLKATLPKSEASSLWTRYKPLLLIALFLIGVTLVIEFASGMFLLETWMANFMAGFFLVFSFFKLLDLNGFADAYQSYDLIASKAKAYGYVYPFIELGLGIAYLLYSDNVVTHLITAIVMFVSLLGVLNAVRRKSNIKCACLGTVFNLPMSTVTIVEDTIMLLMALWMLFKMI